MGHRIGFSPKNHDESTTFLAVMQVGVGTPAPLPCQHWQTNQGYAVLIHHRLLFLPKGLRLLDQPFTLKVPQDTRQLCLTGLAPGTWTLLPPDGRPSKLNLQPGKATAFLQAIPGTWKLSPTP